MRSLVLPRVFGVWSPSASAFVVAAAWLAVCQIPAPAQETTFTATSTNVSEPGRPVKIQLLRWSTEEERTPIVASLDPNAPPPAQAGASGDARGGRGGRGAAGRGGRGGAGRGGRGEASAPPSPIAVLTAAIGRAPTIGYLWTNDITGYSIKYAYRQTLPDGVERIILATDRRLGAYSDAWRPAGAKDASPAPEYAFTVIEIRVDPKGVGEGKTTLTTKVMFDHEAKTVALDDYPAAPVLLGDVKR